MEPYIINGAVSKDERGQIKHNNSFDLSPVRRMYIIQNVDELFLRGWKAHKIEKRWFVAINGAFTIRVAKIDDWEKPSQHIEQAVFSLDAELPDVLVAPEGYATLIKSEKENSRLLVFSDYLLGATNDELNLPNNYFINK